MCGPRAQGLAWAQSAGRHPHLHLMSGVKLLNPLMTLSLPNNKLMSIGKPSPSALYLFFFSQPQMEMYISIIRSLYDITMYQTSSFSGSPEQTSPYFMRLLGWLL